ncbi:hypothetical protein P153DRAFT_356480 [Dothidotthia symphoricarpi CBS 119687]|uniref:F-box domain-containing protein n=1 Tax=Dothidotthia symphoricarpi CBS 119687 TaxID=1392245 RepID=A0A6A6AE03_9PLEO|nr:uncharacterized protein P153DRAFT_356480 [Dothidotthia symphoricarpi CBS 119687]KAF2129796.1 hypothetical protein P153DRAFT_356480 [Dothidotthia symphoricarpi CBS 119687]
MADRKTKVSSLTNNALDDRYKRRQSQLFRELEVLLDLTPSTLSSNLLALPRELRDQIFHHALPPPTPNRPELLTCLWGADMSPQDPWRHDVFGYSPSVPKPARLPPNLLLINRQIRDEVLQIYFRRSKLTLHAELRNTRRTPTSFDYTPHILKLPMLAHISHVRLYVEWNYTAVKKDAKPARLADQAHMTHALLRSMDDILGPLRAVQTIELSVLFFWKYRSGKLYSLSMLDLFDLEDVLKQHAEQRWLACLRTTANKTAGTEMAPAVGYKLSSEIQGAEQSGGMEIFVSRNLEDAMLGRRKSNVDFYGNYKISDPLPEPKYRVGGMI